MTSSEEFSSDVHVISSSTFSASGLSSIGRVMRILYSNLDLCFYSYSSSNSEDHWVFNFTQDLNLFDPHYILGVCHRIFREASGS